MTQKLSTLLLLTFFSIISYSQTTICVDANAQLVGSGNPALVNPWVSSNSSIASVDNNGLILGVSPGNCNVTYTDDLGATTVFPIVVETLLNTVPVLTSAPGTDAQALNFNNFTSAKYYYDTLVDITYQVQSGATISLGAGSTLPLGVTATVSGNTLTISGVPYTTNPLTSPVTFSYTVVGNGINSCSGIWTGGSGTNYNNSSSGSASGTITLNIPCATSIDGSNISFAACSFSGTSASFNLTSGATSATVSGSSFSSSQSGSSVTVFVGSPGSATITTNGHCINNSRTVTVTQIFAYANIQITANQNQTICQGSPISPINFNYGELLQFPNLPAGLIITYNTNGSYTASITGTPTGSGTLNFSLTATSQFCGYQDTKNLSINVLASPPSPTITADGPLSFCTGGSVNLTSSATSGNTWSTSSTNQTINVTNPGTYTVSVSNGTCSASSTATVVTVNNQSVISLGTSSDPSGCGNSNGSVEILGTDSGILTWTGTTSGSANVTLPYIVTNLPEGTYDFTLNTSCSSNIVNAILNDLGTPPPTPTISVNGNLTFCAGQSVSLSSSSASNNTWSNQSSNQTITVSNSGNYFVTVENNGCSVNSDTVVIVVNQFPTKPVISANGPTTICSGQNLVLSSSSTTNNSWSTGSPNQSITVSSSGLYFVTVDNNGCSTNSDSIQVTVKQGPQIPLILVDSSFTFCEGGHVNLSSSVQSNILWSTGDTIPVIDVDTSLTITVTATLNGCSETSAPVSVTEYQNPIVSLTALADICNTAGEFAPSNGSPQGGNYAVNGNPTTTIDPTNLPLGLNALTYTFIDQHGCQGIAETFFNILNCSSVDENHALRFDLYPNPTNGFLYLKGENLNLISLLEVRDELGRTIQVYMKVDEQTQIDLSKLSNGIYNLVLRGEQFVETRQIQKMD